MTDWIDRTSASTITRVITLNNVQVQDFDHFFDVQNFEL